MTGSSMAGSAMPGYGIAGSGVGRIRRAFNTAADQDRAALIVFLAAGDPDTDTTVRLAAAAVEAGADVVELGSPFSDPLADGQVIQAAYTRALANGATTTRTLACARAVAAETGAPVVIMVAFNCVLSYGIERYCRHAAEAGVSGLLVPDLPVDDAPELRAAAAAAGLGTVFLAGPDSGPERVAAVATASTGFVYLVRRRGLTGTGAGGVDLAARVKAARAAGSAPVAVGFGIATPAHAAEVAAVADGVIVGSALVAAAWEAGRHGPERAVHAVNERVQDLAAALRQTPRSPDSTRPTAAATGDSRE